MGDVDAGRREGIESAMGEGWLGLVAWAIGLPGPAEFWVFNRFRIVRVIRVPEVYTRITRNKFRFLKVVPKIRIGYFGFGFRVREFVPRAIAAGGSFIFLPL
jgi:hypothetical protein